MKKVVIYVVAVFYAWTATAQNGCNSEAPGWGKSTGRVSFKTNKPVKIGKQEWSDVVVVANCSKSTYNGGASGNFIADCKRNPSGGGDLFSWCAVVRYQQQLCPRGWRLPTTEDFIELDKALKKASGERKGREKKQKKYSLWKCSFENYCCDSQGEPVNQGSYAFYWSLSEFSMDYGSHMSFNISDDVFPQSNSNKGYGFMLRCIKQK